MSEGYEALRRGAAFLDVSARGRIVARGRDRARLLHNLSTNEVKKMMPGSGCYAFLLNPQGRIQADLHLLCFDEHFLIETDSELRDKVQQHIRRYIIADQVELEDVTARTSEIAIEGPGAAAALVALNSPIPGSDYSHLAWGDATVASMSLTGQPGFRLFCGPEKAAELLHQLASAGAKPATEGDIRQVRIENGKPRYGEDIRENSLPQETQQMHAVSFTKGCYLGQEIVERIRAQGHVNKKLVRVEIEASEAPPAGTKLTANGAEAGEITSGVYSPEFAKVVGLAYVRTPHANSATELQAGDARVLVR
ncbi:Glycine cleavage T protein (Aminomethyl transferase) [Candidatus Sulfopaludibacter sp. SbA3]|nr:Glycine cleavage T protein (Aminomethyl transferase) [Candidatus Sulfopaludibacter sp. SbA3]